MKMTRVFEKALHIEEPWLISHVEFDQSVGRIDIYLDFPTGKKFAYVDKDTGEEEFFPVYGTKAKEWRHLNFFEHVCILHCRTRQGLN